MCSVFSGLSVCNGCGWYQEWVSDPGCQTDGVRSLVLICTYRLGSDFLVHSSCPTCILHACVINAGCSQEFLKKYYT